MMRLKRWQLAVVMVGLVLVLGIMAAPTEDRRYYCKLCGKWRDAYVVSPLGACEKGIELRSRESPSQLSGVLEPLMAGGRCDHQWVVYLRFENSLLGRLWDRVRRRPPVLTHGSYREQQWLILNGNYEFAYIARYEPEVALVAARTLLDPQLSGSARSAYMQKLRTVTLSMAPPRKEDIEFWRDVWGLPPKVTLRPGLW
jgi:hypothetical protein